MWRPNLWEPIRRWLLLWGTSKGTTQTTKKCGHVVSSQVEKIVMCIICRNFQLTSNHNTFKHACFFAQHNLGASKVPSNSSIWYSTIIVSWVSVIVPKFNLCFQEKHSPFHHDHTKWDMLLHKCTWVLITLYMLPTHGRDLNWWTPLNMDSNQHERTRPPISFIFSTFMYHFACMCT